MTASAAQWSRPDGTGPSPRRALAATVIAIVLAVSPIFLVGAVTVLMRSDIAMTQFRLGVCVAVFYGSTAVASVSGGRFADRRGGLRATGVGVVGSGLALVGLALLARQWEHVIAFLVLGGLANGITQPASSLAVAQSMPAPSQGLAFGVKQTDGALATLVAGLAASLIAVPFGWRWAVATVALGTIAFFVVRQAQPCEAGAATADAGAHAPVAKRPLILLAFGMAFATGAGVSMGGFFVDAVVSGGLSVRTAGWLLSGGSVAAAAARVGWGWVADRRTGSVYPLVAALLLAGGAGFVLLGARPGAALLVAATGVAFACGWGWPGLLFYGIVRDNPGGPGEATGIVTAGGSSGGVVAPMVFGWLAQHHGYSAAWRAGGAALAVAAALVLAAEVARRRTAPSEP